MTRRRRFSGRSSLALGGAAVGLASVATALWVAHGRSARRAAIDARDPHPFVELHVPRLENPIAIDAEMDGKKAWESESGSTGVLQDANGKGMVPYSEARVRWRADTLYLWLYAGDLDLEGSVTTPDGDLSRDDAFHVELGSGDDVYAIDVSVLGTVADAKCPGARSGGTRGACDPRWQSGAVVAVDRDGTINQVGDNDEEWVVEMAVPLGSLGIPRGAAGTRIPFSVRRCEVGKGGRGACGSFGAGEPRGELVFEARAADEGATAHAALTP